MNDPEARYKEGFRSAIFNARMVCEEAFSAFYHKEADNGESDDRSRGLRDGLALALTRIVAALTILKVEKERDWSDRSRDLTDRQNFGTRFPSRAIEKGRSGQ